MLVTLALMVVAASSVHASGNGLVLRNLAAIPGNTFPVAVSGHYGAGQMLSLGLTIECSLAKIAGQITSATHGKGSVVSEKCKFVGSEVCLIKNETIQSKPMLVELLLLGKIARAKPLTGTSWAAFEVLSHEEECSLFVGPSSTFGVTGEACGEIVGDLIDLLAGGVESPHCSGLFLGSNKAITHGPPALTVSTSGDKYTTHA